MKKRSLIERHPNDYYRTPAYCTEALLSVETLSAEVWEPACGDGAISRVLERHGHVVLSSDLVWRGYGTANIDFLAVKPPRLHFRHPAGPPSIVTNPPFKLAEEFVEHALKFNPARLCLLLRLSFLEGRKRQRGVFTDRPPARVWVFSDRVTLWHGDDPDAQTTGGAIPYAWFVWDSEAEGPKPELGWIEMPKRPDGLEDVLGALESATKVLRDAVRQYS